MSTIERNAQRSRTLLRGRIEFNDGSSSLDCLIRDFSDTGARIDVSEAVTLPLAFRIYVPKHDRRYQAQLRWHRNGQAGVEFAGAHQSAAAPTGDEGERAKLASLEAEVKRLRGILAAIKADPTRARLLLDDAA